MKKLVNGKIVDIDNIELFELAAEGLALQNTAVSKTNDGLEANINSPLVRQILKQYDVFFKSMPYPLYAIESDIKYATLGNFIMALSKNNLSMWVDRGLYIKLDNTTGMTLKIVNNTWSITYVKRNKNCNISLDLFRDNIGYKEYSWLLNKILNKQTTSNFYEEFMPDFVKACNYQPMILKWELENILNFGYIPNKMCTIPNKIINIDADEEYSLDIYFTGYADTGDKVTTWGLYKDGKQSFKNISVKTYDFDTYVKPLSDGKKTSGKIEKCKIVGLSNLFLELCAVKQQYELSKFPNFEGIISDNNLVFTINNRLYISKSNRIVEAKDIAHGVEIYAIEKGKIYFTKSKRINDRINKESLYSYNINDSTLRICKIIYKY